jgi:hypothetical protein
MATARQLRAALKVNLATRKQCREQVLAWKQSKRNAETEYRMLISQLRALEFGVLLGKLPEDVGISTLPECYHVHTKVPFWFWLPPGAKIQKGLRVNIQFKRVRFSVEPTKSLIELLLRAGVLTAHQGILLAS